MSNIKVLILGAGGIVGQHMTLCQPKNIDAIYTRKKQDDFWYGFDYESDNIFDFLNDINPNVIINLAGENRVDVVEATPTAFYSVNVKLVEDLCNWVTANDAHLIQCSTQGVFNGDDAPYNPSSFPHPITHYGKQKFEAEKIALQCDNAEIDRLTFVLGIRPFKNIGRRNPLEDMIESLDQLQVNDRFFSPLFADEAAEILWERALGNKFNKNKIVHLGTPYKSSRYSISCDLKYNCCGNIKAKIQPVSHKHFPGLAPRPKDTSWQYGTSLYKKPYDEALVLSYLQWNRINKNDS